MILFVFEGKKPENHYLEMLCNKTNIDIDFNNQIKSIYGTVIYQLYSELKNDNDLDVFSLLQENNLSDLNNFNRNKVTEVYLFFDYDPHATNADDEKLKAMLEFFTNETMEGKLFISYPMVEALKHIKDDNRKHIVCFIKECHNYKSLVRTQGIQDIDQLNSGGFMALINRHLEIANNLVNNIDKYPQEIIEQKDIFSQQIIKHIKPNNECVVLSAFPLFYLNYIGL